jgi:hypothetical protein
VKILCICVPILVVSFLLTGCISTPVKSAEPVMPKIPDLHVVVQNGDIPSAVTLLDKGADVNELWNNFPPLFFAAQMGNTNMVKLLIDRGADVNQRGVSGKTPLSEAARMVYIPTAKLLIEKGADIDIAVAGLEQSTASLAPHLSADIDVDTRGTLLKLIASHNSGIRLLERLRGESSPQVQQIQMVPNPSISAQPDPASGGEKRPTGQSDATQRLLDAKKLLDANIITQEEFEAIKAKELPAVLQNPENPRTK